MSKFNVGDLALTIYPLQSVPAGTVVVLEQKLSPGEHFIGPGGEGFTALSHGWICRRPGYPAMLAYAESSLMPLRGHFAPDQQKSKAVPA